MCYHANINRAKMLNMKLLMVSIMTGVNNT